MLRFHLFRPRGGVAARFMPVAPTGGALVLVGPCDLVQQLVAAGLKVAP